MKKIIFILILLISLSGYSAEIKDGIYYVEFSEAGALTTITVAIKTIDSETKQMGYFYRYQYRITDDKVVTYVKLKKDENIFSGFSDKVFFHIKSKDNGILEMKRKEYSEDEIIDLKYIKSIEGSDLFEVMSNLYEKNSSIEDELIQFLVDRNILTNTFTANCKACGKVVATFDTMPNQEKLDSVLFETYICDTCDANVEDIKVEDLI